MNQVKAKVSKVCSYIVYVVNPSLHVHNFSKYKKSIMEDMAMRKIIYKKTLFLF